MDVLTLSGAVLPTLFRGTEDGGVVRNADYLTSAEVR